MLENLAVRVTHLLITTDNIVDILMHVLIDFKMLLESSLWLSEDSCSAYLSFPNHVTTICENKIEEHTVFVFIYIPLVL